MSLYYPPKVVGKVVVHAPAMADGPGYAFPMQPVRTRSVRTTMATSARRLTCCDDYGWRRLSCWGPRVPQLPRALRRRTTALRRGDRPTTRRRAPVRHGRRCRRQPADCRAGRHGPGWQPSLQQTIDARHRRQRHAAQRRRPGLAGVRHQPLYDAGHHHQAARAGDHRLDPARDGLRGVAHRAAGHPQRRTAHAPRLPHAQNAGDRGRPGRPLRQQRGGHLHVLAAGRDARQSQLAHGGPAVAAPGAGADAQRQRLAAGQGGRGHPVGRTAPPQRLPRTQLALPDGQQRAIDAGLGDARPAVRPRRDPPARNGRRLRSVAGPGRRRLQSRFQSAACRPTGG